MNKVVIFDLDGVLIDTKGIHFEALNKALAKINKDFVISKEDQEKIYEGLPTKTKLKILTEKLGLDPALHDLIYNLKQKITEEMLNDFKIDEDLILIMKYIKSKNINIAVASNSIKSTIDKCLKLLGVSDLIDYVASNESVKNPKPHPEMYWSVMSYFNALPVDSIIFEDSVVGKTAAIQSGATLIEVESRRDLTLQIVKIEIDNLLKRKIKYKNGKLNVLIPMAGAGSRFAEAGYILPKPLIEVDGEPMIQSVVKNLSIDATYTYIVQKDHYSKYLLKYMLNAITPGCNIVQVDGITQGAAVTALFAKEYINNDISLVIANSDQIVDWNSKDFMDELFNKNADGGIATFKATHPKWSYAKSDSLGLVSEVAEKRPISDDATVGIYFWKKGSDFVKYAKQMIDNDIRVNNEFYICPVYNEAIQDGKRIYSIRVEGMSGIGTPEDLELYINHGLN